MARRHLRRYYKPKPVDETPADLEGEFTGPPERPPIDYRPIVAVIGIVIFSLAFISFLLALRASR